jgi:DHA1 family inner membrane transport protein
MNSGDPASENNKTPWKEVLLLVGAGIVSAFQVGKAPPVLPAIRAELHMDLFLAGWVLSTFNVIGLFLGSVAGASADRFGYRRLIVSGLFCEAIASLIGSFANGAALLLATRIMEGLGYLSVAVAVPAFIISVTKTRDLRIALSIWSSNFPAGAATIMIFAPFLTAGLGWRGLWQVNSAILAAYAAWVAMLTRPLGGQARGPTVHFRQLWEDMRITSTSTGPLLLATIFSTYALLWLAVMGFLPTLLIEGYGVSPDHASFLTALMVAVNVPGNLVGGWLLQRGFRRPQLIISAIVIMGFCSLTIYSTSLPFIIRYLSCLIFSACGGVLPASITSAVPIVAPRPGLVATTSGLIQQGSSLGQVVGPPALALIVSTLGGWQAAPWFLGSVAAVGTFLSFFVARLERRRHGVQNE